MRSFITSSALIIIVALFACATSGCESVPVGPSLSNVRFTGFNNSTIETRAGWQVSQFPTVFALNSTTVRDPGVCCCHVRGTVNNGNSVPVHVILQFAAMNAANTEIERILDFARDLQPGATYTIPEDGPGAAGFLRACRDIDHVNYQIDVSSAGIPPL